MCSLNLRLLILVFLYTVWITWLHEYILPSFKKELVLYIFFLQMSFRVIWQVPQTIPRGLERLEEENQSFSVSSWEAGKVRPREGVSERGLCRCSGRVPREWRENTSMSWLPPPRPVSGRAEVNTLPAHVKSCQGQDELLAPYLHSADGWQLGFWFHFSLLLQQSELFGGWNYKHEMLQDFRCGQRQPLHRVGDDWE